MKRAGLFLLAVVMVAGLAGFQTPSLALNGTSSKPKDAAYNCAFRQVAAMGYEISADRGIGVVRGFKSTETWIPRFNASPQRASWDIRIEITVVDVQAGVTCMVRGSGKGSYLLGGPEELKS